ncbi:threonine/homoserine efflux transporter RhtA [Bacteroidales bacterium 6E]|nr:threonine/homoserine efflux transporter RhtA [Bacteroidales bacterium 6E]
MNPKTCSPNFSNFVATSLQMMQKHRDLLPIGAALLAMIFWSFSFVWVKVAYQAYGPLTVVLLRLVISVVLLFSFMFIIRRLQFIAKKDIGIFVLLAFFEPFLYFMGESYGLLYVSSTVAAVIVATIPLLAPISAYYFFKERLSLMNVIGLAISFLGVCLVILNDDLSFSASPLGVMLEVLAVIAAIAYSTVLRKLAFRYNTFTIISYQNLFGIIMFLPFWLVFESRDFIATPFHREAFTSIILLSVFASSLAFIFFTYSVRNIGINRSNTFINLIPVFVAIFAWFVLGDKLSGQAATGIAIVIAGLFLAQVRWRRKKIISAS